MVDEGYVKPGIRYRGNDLIGVAIKDHTKCSRVKFTVILYPLLGAPHLYFSYYQFFSFNIDILDYVKNKFVGIRDKFSSKRFIIMTYNLKPKASFFAKCNSENKLLNQTLIEETNSNKRI